MKKLKSLLERLCFHPSKRWGFEAHSDLEINALRCIVCHKLLDWTLARGV
jgi:hypothetical protein